jgi:hypothetical protein
MSRKRHAVLRLEDVAKKIVQCALEVFKHLTPWIESCKSEYGDSYRCLSKLKVRVKEMSSFCMMRPWVVSKKACPSRTNLGHCPKCESQMLWW